MTQKGHKRTPTLVNDDLYLNHPRIKTWYQHPNDSCDLMYASNPPCNRGNLFLTSIEALKGDEGLKMLRDRNVKRVVSMGVNFGEEHPEVIESGEIKLKFCFIEDTVDVAHKLPQFFEPTFQFIDEELKNPEGGSVVVHCRQGISRSASIIIYYLMKRHQITAYLALKRAKKSRSIANPNQGFFKMLQKQDPKEI